MFNPRPVPPLDRVAEFSAWENLQPETGEACANWILVFSVKNDLII
jgi:hypothetical protein